MENNGQNKDRGLNSPGSEEKRRAYYNATVQYQQQQQYQAYGYDPQQQQQQQQMQQYEQQQQYQQYYNYYQHYNPSQQQVPRQQQKQKKNPKSAFAEFSDIFEQQVVMKKTKAPSTSQNSQPKPKPEPKPKAEPKPKPEPKPKRQYKKKEPVPKKDKAEKPRKNQKSQDKQIDQAEEINELEKIIMKKDTEISNMQQIQEIEIEKEQEQQQQQQQQLQLELELQLQQALQQQEKEIDYAQQQFEIERETQKEEPEELSQIPEDDLSEKIFLRPQPVKQNMSSDSGSSRSISQISLDSMGAIFESPQKMPVIQNVIQRPISKKRETKIIPRDICEKFMKFDQKNTEWQLQNTGSIPYCPNQKSFIISAFIDIGNRQKVYLIEHKWLLNLRNYIHKLMTIYDENPSCIRTKKKVLTKNEQFENLKLEMNDFQCLDNQSLIDPCSRDYLKCNESSPLNVYIKQVDLKSCILESNSNENGIKYQKDFDIVLLEMHDFLVCQASWFAILESYTAIPRNYLRDENSIRCTLEMNFLQLEVKHENRDYRMQIHHNCTLHSLKQRLSKLFEGEYKIALTQNEDVLSEISTHFNDKEVYLKQFIDPEEMLVKINLSSANTQIEFKAQILAAICNYCRISAKATRSKQKPQMIPCRCLKVLYCSHSCKTKDLKFHENKCEGKIETINDWVPYQETFTDYKFDQFEKKKKGLAGLQNLANSCYMNCALQCLSHCKALTNYFLKGDFIKEINSSNPLGAQGLISIAYGKVIKELWLGDQPVVVPINFKQILGRFKKQFASEEQQDSQELLNIVLDSLHEDLNRVKIKPLVPMIESHGENDERASIEAWEAHLKRSQSIIVDLMHGQYKSTVRCPDCNHLSITFEAFNQIILPIPEIRLITKQFVWVPSDINTKCSVHKFIIKGHESIKNLRKYITYEILQKQDLCHDENGFEIVQINNDQIHRVMCHQNFAIGLQSHDYHLFLFQIPKTALPEKKDEQINDNGSEEINMPINEEISTRLNSDYLLTFLNIQLLEYQTVAKNQVESQLSDTYFPRLTYFQLENSLIQIHLEIFNKIKYVFTRYLELRDAYSHHSNQQAKIDSIEDTLFKKKLTMKIPPQLNLEKWNQMSLSEQYEIVFSTQNYTQNGSQNHKNQYNTSQQSFQDPSRRKPMDLPYFVRLVSRKAVRQESRLHSSSEENESKHSSDSGGKKKKPDLVKCIYCLRKYCEGCPLPFDDRMTLRDFLMRSKAPLKSSFYFKDDDEINTKKPKSKSKISPAQKSKSAVKNVASAKKICKYLKPVDESIPLKEDENLDFEIIIQFNKNSCWGLYELLVRGQNQRQNLMSQIQLKKTQLSQPEVKQQEFFIDKVTISDCFRQFNRPEKLSQQNEWYCDHCKLHKQACKKIQVYKLPPILIITLKRFKGQHTSVKQNTPVYYPIDGLNMKNFMIRQEVDDQIYDLFAVVLHTGTLNGGHYTSLVKSNGNWYEFNDHMVIKLAKHERSKVISNHAYILFYQKRGIDFDNIQNYSQIKNALTTIGKVEKFQQETIEFPKLLNIPSDEEDEEQSAEEDEEQSAEEELIEPEIPAPPVALVLVEMKKRVRYKKNQGQIFDEDISDSFQEINLQSYQEWLKEQQENYIVIDSSSESSSEIQQLMVNIDLTERKRDKKYVFKIPSQSSKDSWEYCNEVLEMPKKYQKVDETTIIQIAMKQNENSVIRRISYKN